MTIDQFFSYLEAYYGEPYPDAVREYMAEYLDGKSGDFLKTACDVLIKRVSRLYGRVPGVAEIERYLDEIQGERTPGRESKGTVDVDAICREFNITGSEPERRRRLLELREQGAVSF
jgi:hypothetical protein